MATAPYSTYETGRTERNNLFKELRELRQALTDLEAAYALLAPYDTLEGWRRRNDGMPAPDDNYDCVSDAIKRTKKRLTRIEAQVVSLQQEVTTDEQP